MLLVCLWVLIVYCIDVSGAIDKLNIYVWNKLNPGVRYTDWRMPLVSCSLCVTFWVGIITIIATGLSFNYILIVIGMSFLSDVLANTMFLLKDLIKHLINKIYEIID